VLQRASYKTLQKTQNGSIFNLAMAMSNHDEQLSCYKPFPTDNKEKDTQTNLKRNRRTFSPMIAI
jgi:hypothetical protein